MLSRLEERRRRVSASVDRAFAQMVRVTPMLTGGAVMGGADPSIPPYEVVGVYQEMTGTAQVKARGSGKGERLEARGTRRTFSFALGAFGANPKPETGWHLTLIEQDPPLTFRVVPGGEGPQGRLTYDTIPLGADD